MNKAKWLVAWALLLAISATICGCATGSDTRKAEQTVKAAASQPALPATTETVSGSWSRSDGTEQSGPNQQLPARVVLNLEPDGSGDAWSYVDANASGLSDTFEFTYTLQGSRILLNFEDGHVEALEVDSLKRDLMVTSVEGAATWAADSVWARSRD